MEGRFQSEYPSNRPAAAEPTIDCPVPELPTGTVSEPGGAPHVALVAGAGPGLSGETAAILRARLRVAAATLFAGFAIFLGWRLLSFDPGKPLALSMLVCHVLLTLALGACGVRFFLRRAMPMWTLRVYECLIFGLPAAFLMLLQGSEMLRCADEYNMLPSLAAPWLMLMFTYALFIPNTWSRASVPIAGMAVAPLVVLATACYHSTSCAAALGADWTSGVSLALTMAMSAAGAVIGVHTIGSLRREVFEAKRMGQYRLRHLIGSGGMGEVYLAEHQLMKRPCAIKVIRPEKAGDPRVLARFEREVRSTAKLSHWNNIDIYDYGRTDDGTFYYVMEFLPGMSLQELVERYGPLPAERVIHLLRQTCDALAEAHEIGLIHRDIKPANIFAAYRGGIYDVAKLLDFGLAKPLSNFQSTDLTVEGAITGSPHYMSPEQATGDERLDARSDIYSLGAVAYYLLTGRPPFGDRQPIKVLLAHARERPAPPSQFADNVPEDIERVVLHCLEKEPNRRYQDVVGFSAALGQCESAGRWTRQQAARWWQANGEALQEAKPAVPSSVSH